jgi:CheY-like chemotaxis protein
LFLHRNVARLPERQRGMLEKLYHEVLEGRKVLLVDDDVRNIFAMTSILERFKMNVISAENGRDGIEKLVEAGDVDIVLMDIMLPTMDGYATTRAIRELANFKDLPIIAVTAKAMKGDREKCLAAGASDYLSKPVNPEQLRSLLRVWLRR